MRNLIICLLVLSLTACGDKAIGKDVTIQLAEKVVQENNAQLSRKISEVAPPEIIQELRQSLEVYQPQVKILNPQPDEVLEVIKNLKDSNAKDIYDLSTTFIKLAAPAISSNLSIIFNKSIHEGTFPELFKVAKVTPLHVATYHGFESTVRVLLEKMASPLLTGSFWFFFLIKNHGLTLQ